MNTMNFILKKKEEVYDNYEKFDKKLNKKLIDNYDNLTQDEKDLFFLNNTRLIALEVKQIITDNDALREELFGIGMIGLHKAIKTFDKNKGYAFSALASTCIRNEILMFLRKEKKYQNLISLNYIVKENDNSIMTLEDTLCDDSINTVDDVNKKIMYEKVVEMFPDLKQRDVFILINFFGINDNDEMTLSKIAELLGYSQSYISRCKQKVLMKINDNLKD